MPTNQNPERRKPANDGGPAFPQPHADWWGTGLGGMSLRDWFAGQAMNCIKPEFIQGPQPPELTLAEWCYKIADAMLAERERTHDA